MIHEGKVIGAIGAAHPGAEPFDDRQVALIKTFADQAVIAIENVRLFNETREALAQQTASADILRVISRSPTDVQPVFATIAKNALRACTGADVREGVQVRRRSAIQRHREPSASTGTWNCWRKATFPMRPDAAGMRARFILTKAGWSRRPHRGLAS